MFSNTAASLFDFSIAVKNDRLCLGAERGGHEVRLSHPTVFNFMRQLMLQNGQIERLVFGVDFRPAELNMIRG